MKIENNKIYTVDCLKGLKSLDDESVEDLIIYAAGLTSMASSTILIDKMSSVKSRDNDDSAFSSKNIYTKMANLEI